MVRKRWRARTRASTSQRATSPMHRRIQSGRAHCLPALAVTVARSGGAVRGDDSRMQGSDQTARTPPMATGRPAPPIGPGGGASELVSADGEHGRGTFSHRPAGGAHGRPLLLPPPPLPSATTAYGHKLGLLGHSAGPWGWRVRAADSRGSHEAGCCGGDSGLGQSARASQRRGSCEKLAVREGTRRRGCQGVPGPDRNRFGAGQRR